MKRITTPILLLTILFYKSSALNRKRKLVDLTNVPDNCVVDHNGDVICNDPNCKNENENCEYWATIGECEKNPGYMNSSCAKACGTCTPALGSIDEDNIINNDVNLDDYSPITHTNSNVESEILKYGVAQEVAGIEAEKTLNIMLRTVRYMEELRADPSVPETTFIRCKNLNDLCSLWSALGECKKNPRYMLENCGPACSSCN
jgi:hypothetical protein